MNGFKLKVVICAINLLEVDLLALAVNLKFSSSILIKIITTSECWIYVDVGCLCSFQADVLDILSSLWRQKLQIYQEKHPEPEESSSSEDNVEAADTDEEEFVVASATTASVKLSGK